MDSNIPSGSVLFFTFITSQRSIEHHTSSPRNNSIPIESTRYRASRLPRPCASPPSMRRNRSSRHEPSTPFPPLPPYQQHRISLQSKQQNHENGGKYFVFFSLLNSLNATQ